VADEPEREECDGDCGTEASGSRGRLIVFFCKVEDFRCGCGIVVRCCVGTMGSSAPGLTVARLENNWAIRAIRGPRGREVDT